MANGIPERSEIAAQDCWAITDLYAADADWEADYARAEALTAQSIEEVYGVRTRLIKDAEGPVILPELS